MNLNISVNIERFIAETFRKFDYGLSKNLLVYGSTQPPKYNLERVKVPVYIFYSENDFLTHPVVSYYENFLYNFYINNNKLFHN